LCTVHTNKISLWPFLQCYALRKTYKHMVQIALIMEKNDTARDSEKPLSTVPDLDLWYRVAVALYSVCSSIEPDISKHGWECLQRHILTVEVEDVPDEKWIGVLHLILSKHPPLSAETSRMNTFSIFTRLILRVFARLTQNQKNFKLVTEITKKLALIAEENLQHGRKGNVKPLFEYTLKSVTSMANYFVSPDFSGDKRFSAWASETLVSVLERNGAAGGSAKNRAHTKAPTTSNDEDHASNGDMNSGNDII